MFFGHRSLNSCNCRRGNCKFANVSQILSRDISGIRPWNDAVVPVSRTFRSKSVDSSMKLRNSPSKGFPLEVAFAPAITVSRYENGGPVAQCYACCKAWICWQFRTKVWFKNFANSKICKSLWRSRFLDGPKPFFLLWADRKSRFPRDPYFLSIF